MFCLGIAKASDIIKGVASGVGNAVYYVGAKTGRDGIHGATMASAEFDEKSAEKRPAVQVGDPFMEKLLLEACLEVMQTDALVGIQDMGAAGLTCSTTEMGSRGGAGVEIDVSLVPQRETGMTPYEIMLSESQERMLLVVKRGREAEVERIFEKWDLHAVHIGEVTDDGMLRVKERGTVVAEIPNRALTDEAPVYSRPMERARVSRARCSSSISTRWRGRADADARAMRCWRCSRSPTIASKRWVYRQYDHMVQTNTINLPGLGAGVVRIKGTDRALAMSVDGNGRYCYLDPQRGAMLAVAEAARNVACAGRAAARRHQLPELRQPRAAGDHVAVRAGGRRHRRGVPRARRADHRRQRQPVQRDRRQGDLSDAGHRRRRAARARRPRGRPPLPGVGRRRSCCSARARRARRQRVSEGRCTIWCAACRRRSISTAERALQALLVDARRRAADAVGARLLGRRAGGDARRMLLRHRRHRRRGLDRRRRRVARARPSTTRRRCSASRRRASSSRRRRTTSRRCCERAAAAGVPARVIGQTGGNRLRIAVGGAIVDRRVGGRSRARLVDGDRIGISPSEWPDMPTCDKFKDECGVFGIFGHPEAANMTYLGLYALQHRGQESAGIAASDGAAGPRVAGDGLRRRRLRRRDAGAPARVDRRSATSAIRPPARASCRTRSRF